jgi:uncharacterized protein YndB with AHSA1/START domain
MIPNQIEKCVVLRAPLVRVWEAIADSQRFGTWFGVAFDGPFVAGAHLTGKIMPSCVDPDVAMLQQPYTGKPFEFHVEAIEPMRRIAFRWHPYAIESGIDYTTEPMTLIVFELAETDGGTRLTITESGFDQIPLERHTKAFTANDGGWTIQATLIAKYLAAEAAP